MNIHEFVKCMDENDVNLESRYRWRDGKKYPDKLKKDSRIVPSLAISSKNHCGKQCNNNDKKLVGRIFYDFKDRIEDTINYDEFLELLLHMADEYNPDRSDFIYNQMTGS